MSDPNEIFQEVADDIKNAEHDMENARVLIDAMKEAGEEVIEMEKDFRDTRLRVDKWKRMLKSRGANI